MIRELYDDYSRLGLIEFKIGRTAVVGARLARVRALIHRWQAIRDRVYGLRLWALEVTRDRD